MFVGGFFGKVVFFMKQKGQGIVEFAIIVPFIIAVGVSIIYVGAMMVNYMEYTNAVRMAARDIALQNTIDTSSVSTEGAARQTVAKLRKELIEAINASGTTGASKTILSRYLPDETNGAGGFYDSTWSATLYMEDSTTASGLTVVSDNNPNDTSKTYVIQVNANLTLKDSITIGVFETMGHHKKRVGRFF